MPLSNTFWCKYILNSMCVLGKRLLKDIKLEDCHKQIGGALHQVFCNGTSTCDPYYASKFWFVIFFCFYSNWLYQWMYIWSMSRKQMVEITLRFAFWDCIRSFYFIKLTRKSIPKKKKKEKNYSKIIIIHFKWIGHNVTIVKGIKGLASGVFFENLGNSFLEVSKKFSLSVLY